MKVVYPITLDVKKTNIQKKISAFTEEGGVRELVITLVSGNDTIEVTNDYAVSVVGVKPDGTEFANTATVRDGKIHYTLTTQNVAVAGDVDCQIRVFKTGELLYTSKFLLRVENNLSDEESETSSNEWTELITALNRVNALSVVFTGEGAPTTDPQDYPDIQESNFYYDETNARFYYATNVSTTVTWERIPIKTESSKVYTAVFTEQGYLDTDKSNYSGIKANDLIKGGTNDNRLWSVDYIGGQYVSATQMKNVYVISGEPTTTNTGAKLYNEKDVVVNDDTIYYCASVTASETTPIEYSYTWTTVISADDYYTKSQTYSKTQVDSELAAKQDTIDSSHKLSADLLSDGTTNKPSVWNAKQNALTAGSGIDITSDTISFKRQNAPNNLLKATSGYYYVSQEDIGYSEGVREALQNSSFNYALAPKAIVSEEAPPVRETDSVKLDYGQVWIWKEDADYNSVYVLWNKTNSGSAIYSTYHWLPVADASNVQDKLTTGNGIDITNNAISIDISSISSDTLGFSSGKLWLNTTALATDTGFLASMPYNTTIRQRLTDSSVNNPLQPKLTAGTNITIDSNNVISASGGGLSYTFTDGLAESSGTVGIDLASGSKLLIDSNDKLDVDLSSYVKNTDYATSSVAGVLKSGSNWFQVSSQNGVPVCDIKTYQQYLNVSSNNVFISKGTLENVITGKQLVNQTDLSSKQDTIDTTHKLSADLVTDTSATNKFVPTHSSTESGKVLGVDSNGDLEWTTKGSGGSYSGGDGIDISNDTISVDLKSGTELQITSGELDIDLSNYATTSSVSGKEDKTTISTDTSSTTVSLTLADNHEYRYTQDLTSLTLTMPNGDFISSIVFASGSTPTSMTYDSSIKWSGDDVTNGQFVPTEKTYNIVMWYDGINVNGVVRGV